MTLALALVALMCGTWHWHLGWNLNVALVTLKCEDDDQVDDEN